MARGLNGSANGSSRWLGSQGGVEARRPGGESNLPAEVVDALPAVVGVHTTIPENRRSAQTLGAEREGHGIVIDDEGLVVTIGYLIMEAATVTVTDSDGHKLDARLVGYDYESGFGLVRTVAPPPVRPMAFGDSDSLALRSEAYVAGVGGEKATLKVKVAGRREFAGYWEYLLDEALFTTPPHPEWSGTALLDDEGRLIGIGSLLLQEKSDDETVDGNMFVPVDLLEPILDDLLRTGRRKGPRRPWLGMYTADAQGRVIVNGVAAGGPAERAGVATGDLVVAVAGERVASLADLFRQIWRQGPAGTEIALTLARSGTPLHLQVRSADRDDLLKKPSLQ